MAKLTELWLPGCLTRGSWWCTSRKHVVSSCKAAKEASEWVWGRKRCLKCKLKPVPFYRRKKVKP